MWHTTTLYKAADHTVVVARKKLILVAAEKQRESIAGSSGKGSRQNAAAIG
jgi:hypothetical protein